MWVVWFCSLMRIGNRSFLYEWGWKGLSLYGLVVFCQLSLN